MPLQIQDKSVANEFAPSGLLSCLSMDERDCRFGHGYLMQICSWMNVVTCDNLWHKMWYTFLLKYIGHKNRKRNE